MSLISQNAKPKSDLGNLVNKKRKKGYSQDVELEIEQEREKRNELEDLLFGSIYSPVQFGKEDEEEVGKVDVNENGSALFVTDRSANSVLSVYKEDANGLDMVDFKVVGEERKPVWEDEEKETHINIDKVNRSRKLRKEEGESLIDGSDFVSRLRAQHVKLNPSTEWARLVLQPRGFSSDSDGELSDEEKSAVMACVSWCGIAMD